MDIDTQQITGTALSKPLPTISRVSVFLERYPILLIVAASWLVFMVFVAVFAEWLAPYDFTQTNLRNRLLPPVFLGGVPEHFFGTDQLGRDILSRLIISIRMSLLVALIGTLIGAIIGTVLGFVAAHFKGWIDDIIMVFVDFQASMPFIIIALAVLAFAESNSMFLFIAVVGVQGWERYARITRGLSLSAFTHGYAVALRTLGAGSFRVYFRHVFPNIASALIVTMTLNFPQTILLETSMSFLGVGIQPPNTSLGSMLSSGRDFLLNQWWIAFLPGLAIFFMTLPMSIVGDWLRDRLDPTLK